MSRKQNAKKLSRNNDGVIEPKSVSIDDNPCKCCIGAYSKEIKLLPLELRPIVDQEDKRKAELLKVDNTNLCCDGQCNQHGRLSKIPRIPRKLRASTGTSCCSKVRHCIVKCPNTSNVYRNILGPTADESILAGLQTVIDICGLVDCCRSDSEISTSVSSENVDNNEAPCHTSYSQLGYDNVPYRTIIQAYAVHETKELSANEDHKQFQLGDANTTLEEAYVSASSRSPSREETYHSAQASSLSGNNTIFNTPNSSFVATPSSRSRSQDATFHSAQGRSSPGNNTTFHDVNSSFPAPASPKSPSEDATYRTARTSSPPQDNTNSSFVTPRSSTLESRDATFHSAQASTPNSSAVTPSARKNKSREQKSSPQKQESAKTSSKSNKSHSAAEKDVSFAYPPATSTPLPSPEQSKEGPLGRSSLHEQLTASPTSPAGRISPINLFGKSSSPSEDATKPVAESFSANIVRSDDSPVYSVSSESWCRIDECCGTAADNTPCVKIKGKDGRDVCIKYRCRSIASSLSAKCFPPVEIPPCEDSGCRRYFGLDKGIETDDYLTDLEAPYSRCSVCSVSEGECFTTFN